jgi:hypothetical protein
MRTPSWIFGLLLILFGGIILVGNLYDINLWPLLLVALGIWLIAGLTIKGPRVEAEEASIPLDGASHARIRIGHGAGRLQIGAGAGPDELLSGSFGGGLKYSRRLEGDRISVSLSVRERMTVVIPRPFAAQSALDWTVRLNDQVPLELRLDTGASETRADLSDLIVTDLELKTGASSSTITLPDQAGYTHCLVESGVASLTITVPEGVAAQIWVDSGLSSISIDRNRFPRSGGSYRSPEYDTAENKVDIRIKTGVGSVSIH